MKPHRLGIGVLIAICLVTASVAAYALLALRASDALLKQITNVKPGVAVNTVREELGKEMYALTDPASVIQMGSIKDERFCTGKKLFIFYSSMPPTRALEVYTDKDDLVVFVSWHQL